MVVVISSSYVLSRRHWPPYLLSRCGHTSHHYQYACSYSKEARFKMMLTCHAWQCAAGSGTGGQASGQSSSVFMEVEVMTNEKPTQNQHSLHYIINNYMALNTKVKSKIVVRVPEHVQLSASSTHAEKHLRHRTVCHYPCHTPYNMHIHLNVIYSCIFKI